MKATNALILYYTRHTYPLRDTIQSYLYAWRRYSDFRCLYHNAAFSFPTSIFSNWQPDVVILSTTFLSARWNPDTFQRVTENCQDIQSWDCLKIAMPQDEFLRSGILDTYLSSLKTQLILTCASLNELPRIYPKSLLAGAKPYQVLTGYIDDYSLKRISNLSRTCKPFRERPVDVGYRAWSPEYWLGDLGQQKTAIGLEAKRHASIDNLKSDISFDPSAVLNGDEWFTFLLNSKTTLGCEGGASLFDPEGAIQHQVKQYLSNHPQASYEEVKSAIFPDSANNFEHKNITPRHFEACMTRTLQILIEGNYKGILQPNIHYIPVKPNLSNLPEALHVIRDPKRCEEVVSKAYNDIVLSGKWSYRKALQAICQRIDDILLMQGPNREKSHLVKLQGYTHWLLFKVRDWLHWRFIQIEIEAHKPNANRLTALIYKCLTRLVKPLSV